MDLRGLLVLGALGASPALAAPPSYTIEKIAHEGDPTPSGGTISQLFGDASIDDDGRVVFNAIDSGTTQILFLWDGISLGSAVAEGDVAPETGGALVLSPGRGRVAAPDLLSYTAIYEGAGPPFGAFVREGASGSALLLPGSTAPGGGTVSAVDWAHDMNEAGTVAFAGLVDPGDESSVAAHFVGTPGAVSEVFREGSATPIGGTFSGVQTFHRTALAANGSLAFAATVSDGSASSGLFHWSAGVITPLLTAGATLPAGGGTVELFGSWAGSNEAGDVAFNANVQLPGAPFATEGVYVLASGLVREVIQRGDAISGTSPTLFFQGLLGSTPPDLSAQEVVIFTALLEDGFFTPFGALIAEHGGFANTVVVTGDDVPGVPGAVFTNFSDARVNSSGRIAFTASTSAGVGVFVATPERPVPALGGAALLLVVVALAGSSAVLLRRRSRGARTPIRPA